MNKLQAPVQPGMAIWLVLLAAGGAFALTMGVRQTMGLFLSALNTSTALGIGSISLAFAFGQLCVAQKLTSAGLWRKAKSSGSLHGRQRLQGWPWPSTVALGAHHDHGLWRVVIVVAH